jgi:type VI secretion system lysozyme-like protein
MAELVLGSPVPLFDRLGALDAPANATSASASSALLSPEQLQWSIGRELAHLLNTRSARSAAEFMHCGGTSIDYGIPDFGHLSSQSRQDLDQLESLVKKAIGFFEPRLRNVQVQALVSAQAASSPLLAISGLVTIGLKLRQLNFELQLDPHMAPRGKAS